MVGMGTHDLPLHILELLERCWILFYSEVAHEVTEVQFPLYEGRTVVLTYGMIV